MMNDRGVTRTLVVALAALGALTPLAVSQSAHAASIDPCLVGTWQATSVTLLGNYSFDRTAAGGDGFRVTFAADGTETADYTTMTPFTWPRDPSTGFQDSIVWRGKAAVTISTDHGVAKIERMGEHTAEWTDPLVLRVWSPGGLGPGMLGSTKNDNAYACSDATLTYKTQLWPDNDKPVAYAVGLARVTGASPPSPPAVAVHGTTWLTVTELKNRPQDLRGVWRDPDADLAEKFTWLDPQPSGRLINHSLDDRGSDPSYLDVTRKSGQQYDGLVYICPRPKGTCPNLCQWGSGAMALDADNLKAVVNWRGQKNKSDCSGFTDEPDDGNLTITRLVGVAFVPIAAGKYMELVGAPAVGDQAAQFKAAARIEAHYDDVPNAQVKATADHGTVTPSAKAKGIYDLVVDRSGVTQITFELIGTDGQPFHVDRLRIDVPGIPGVGK